MHLPVGWGEIPCDKIFPILKYYNGVLFLELKPRYNNFFIYSLTKVKELIDPRFKLNKVKKQGKI